MSELPSELEFFQPSVNYHIPPAQPKGLPTSSVVATATSLGASFLCQLTSGMIANIQGTNLEGSKLQRLLLDCGEVARHDGDTGVMKATHMIASNKIKTNPGVWVPQSFLRVCLTPLSPPP